jgi:hypothetical protein
MVTFSESIDIMEYVLTKEERESKKNAYRLCRYMGALNRRELLNKNNYRCRIVLA